MEPAVEAGDGDVVELGELVAPEEAANGDEVLACADSVNQTNRRQTQPGASRHSPVCELERGGGVLVALGIGLAWQRGRCRPD